MNKPNQTGKEHFPDITRITKGAGVNFIGIAGGKILLFFYTIFIAKALGPSDLGIYFLGLTITSVLTSIAIMGMNYGVIRLVAIYWSRKDFHVAKGIVLTACAISVTIGSFVAAMLFFANDFLAFHVFHKPKLAEIIRLLSLSIPFEALMGIFLGSTQGLKIMQHTAFIGNLMWMGLRIFYATIFLYGFDMGLEGIALAYVASSVTSAAFAFYYSNRHIHLTDRSVAPVFSQTKELLRFSIPMVFTAFLDSLVRQTDILMIGLFLSAGQVGLYSVAVRLIFLAEFVFQIFRSAFNPFIAELHSKRDFLRLSHLLKITTRWNVTASLPIFLSLLFFPAFFLNIFGKGFIEASGCLAILVIAHLFSSLSHLPDSIIFMSGRSDITFKNNFGLFFLNALLNYLMIPKYGIQGAALATGLSLVIIALLRIFQVYYLIKIHPFETTLWKPVLAASVSICVPVFLNTFFSLDGNQIFTTILLCLFFSLYAAFIYLLKFSEEEIHIKNMIRKKLKLIHQ